MFSFFFFSLQWTSFKHRSYNSDFSLVLLACDRCIRVPTISHLLRSVSGAVVPKLESASESPKGLIKTRLQGALPQFLSQSDVGGACWFACLTSSQMMLIPLDGENFLEASWKYQSHCVWWMRLPFTKHLISCVGLLVTESAMGKRHWPRQLLWKKKRILLFQVPIPGSCMMDKGRRHNGPNQWLGKYGVWPTDK